MPASVEVVVAAVELEAVVAAMAAAGLVVAGLAPVGVQELELEQVVQGLGHIS